MVIQEAVIEVKNIVDKNNINKLFDDKQAKKIFKEEIFPIIKFCEFIKAEQILFCGQFDKSIDAKAKMANGKILNIECTTSINARYKELLFEYNRQYHSCFIAPHSKAVEINNINEANNNDIVYSGSKHKRTFVKQEDLNNEDAFLSCIVDVNKYVQEDIEKIQHKIDKGNNENLYKNFILVLACEHSIDIQQIQEYQYLLYEYWQNITDNPFSGLFVVNYDSILFTQTNQDEKLDSSNTPVPILFIND